MAKQIMDDFCLSNVKFIQRLHKSRHSQLFHVEALGRECVLKVVKHQYHAHIRRNDYVHESKLFTWESTAYRRLKETGICAKGLVPDFYGAVTAIEAKKWPELKSFNDDLSPPNGIFIECIPGLERIHLGNYTQERLDKLTEMLAEIHAVRVLHDDGDPRNMAMTFSGEKERVLWVDFDRALKFPTDQPLTERDAERLRGELILMKDVAVRPVRHRTPWYHRRTLLT
ncbi:hypothetical protein LLEC1_06076 [Akanthomyces lecanii]|uniref:Protein kinase domain-containing protein n=1 Tax=Cordyceps confragosa TaxID=2714763 RepID=A0A179ID21_CORDF|nr:hypothetical protein LLEC1_06076 [Akanthomyces lecanii]